MREPTTTSLPPKMEAHLDELVVVAVLTASRSGGEDALNDFSDMLNAIGCRNVWSEVLVCERKSARELERPRND